MGKLVTREEMCYQVFLSCKPQNHSRNAAFNRSTQTDVLFLLDFTVTTSLRIE